METHALQISDRLFNKNFLLLTQGQSVSRVGSELFEIVLILWVKELTGSAMITGMVLAIGGVIFMLLTPFTGTFADQYSRKRIIVWTDLLQGGAMLGLTLFLFLGPKDSDLIIIAIIVVTIVGEILTSFFGPAVLASVPDIVPRTKVDGANSVIEITGSMAIFIGQALGGTLFQLLGAPLIILFNGVTFLFSGISELFIEIPQTFPSKGISAKEQFALFRSEMMAGFHYIWHAAGLRDMVILTTILNFILAPCLLLLPFFVEDYLRVGPEWYGFLLAGTGVGMVIGAIIVGVVPLSPKQQSRTIISLLLAQALLFGALAVVRDPWVALLLMCLGGICEGGISVKTMSLIQTATPSYMRGRMFGLLSTLTAAVISLGFGLAGFITDLVGQDIPTVYFIFSGVAIISILGFAVSRDLITFLSIVPLEERGENEVDLVVLGDDLSINGAKQIDGIEGGHHDQ